jgi:TetR/AcrR family transcriptional repressor of lmrAB and yxaGH operons
VSRTVHERADVIPLVAEVFREFGYEGASFSQITARTGLGKGSLYHFFPGGKQEMAAAVLAEVDGWFEIHLYARLRGDEPPQAAIAAMWAEVDAYFQTGRRICLVGAFALDSTRDQFAGAIADYFRRWIAALQAALMRGGVGRTAARGHAEEAVFGIQGALVLSRALDDKRVFADALRRMATRLDEALKAQVGKRKRPA